MSKLFLSFLALALVAVASANDMEPPAAYAPPPEYVAKLFYVYPNSSIAVGDNVTFYGEGFIENCTAGVQVDAIPGSNGTTFFGCGTEFVSDEELICEACAVGEIYNLSQGI
eukprot:gene15102-21156_t